MFYAITIAEVVFICKRNVVKRLRSRKKQEGILFV